MKQFISILLALIIMGTICAVSAAAADLGVNIREGRKLVYTQTFPIQVPDNSKKAIIIMKEDGTPVIITYGADSEQAGYGVDLINLLDPAPQEELQQMELDSDPA